jgi:hypothetical protein
MLVQPIFHEYWVASRTRLGRWTDGLLAISQRIEWRSQPLLALGEEILLAEVLVRVWVGWLRAVRRIRPSDALAEWEPVASGILRGHDEGRNRLLRFISTDRQVPADIFGRLDIARRRAERWTDLMLAVLAREGGLSGAAVADLVHLAEPAPIWRRRSLNKRREVVCLMLRSALRSHYRPDAERRAPQGELNRRVAVAVVRCLGCWAPEVVWRLSSLWEARMVAEAEDIAAWIAAYDDTSAGRLFEPAGGRAVPTTQSGGGAYR